uniref:Uncharacterized protein n=1 Tax=Setaria viridis TaxID=4556 RepID=A0A4U6UYD8_SETVI|nr:hypothetical protein SEVIR_4G045601v2 [Setaria viridis]
MLGRFLRLRLSILLPPLFSSGHPFPAESSPARFLANPLSSPSALQFPVFPTAASPMG